MIEAKASYPEGNVVVRYDPAVVTPAEIANTIATETYFTVGEPVAGGDLSDDASSVAGGAVAVIKVEGMTDDRTASLVTQAVGGVAPVVLPGMEPAIRDVSLDPAQSMVTVTYDSDQVSPQDLVDAVEQGTGLQASLLPTTSPGGDGGANYTAYVVLAIAGLFAAAVAWPAISWGRRRLARAGPSRAHRRQEK